MLGSSTPASYWWMSLLIAVVAGVILAILVAGWRALPKLLRKEFNAAVDERVAPPIAVLRAELREHTEAEKELVRGVVKEELAPFRAALNIQEGNDALETPAIPEGDRRPARRRSTATGRAGDGSSAARKRR